MARRVPMDDQRIEALRVAQRSLQVAAENGDRMAWNALEPLTAIINDAVPYTGIERRVKPRRWSEYGWRDRRWRDVN